MLVTSKSGFSNLFDDSSPSFGTKKSLNRLQFKPVFDEATKLCHNTVPELYPYRKAKLVHHQGDLSKRWYVDFAAWDVSKNKLVRRRLFEPLNRINSLSQRLQTGEDMVRIVNAQLAAGKVFGKDKVNKTVPLQPGKLNLLEAIEWVLEQKRLNGNRKNYYRTFKALHTNVTAWLEFKKHPDFPLQSFDRNDAHELFSFLRDERKLANKSINNTMRNLATAFNFVQRKSGVLWKNNPLVDITRLPVHVKKHAAFTDEQIKIIKKEIAASASRAARHRKPGYVQLELFISFIYYTLARPAELMQLKVGDINMKENRIFFRAEISKNKTDDYVEIAPPLAKIIIQSNILNYPANYLCFTSAGVPGTVPVHGNFFWDKHKRVLNRTGLLKINSQFTIYGYKHSGAISLYRQTKDIKLVQRQCRHQSLEQTNTYLRDLGMLTNFNQLKAWKGAV